MSVPMDVCFGNLMKFSIDIITEDKNDLAVISLNILCYLLSSKTFTELQSSWSILKTQQICKKLLSLLENSDKFVTLYALNLYINIVCNCGSDFIKAFMSDANIKQTIKILTTNILKCQTTNDINLLLLSFKVLEDVIYTKEIYIYLESHGEFINLIDMTYKTLLFHSKTQEKLIKLKISFFTMKIWCSTFFSDKPIFPCNPLVQNQTKSYLLQKIICNSSGNLILPENKEKMNESCTTMDDLEDFVSTGQLIKHRTTYKNDYLNIYFDYLSYNVNDSEPISFPSQFSELILFGADEFLLENEHVNLTNLFFWIHREILNFSFPDDYGDLHNYISLLIVDIIPQHLNNLKIHINRHLSQCETLIYGSQDNYRLVHLLNRLFAITRLFYETFNHVTKSSSIKINDEIKGIVLKIHQILDAIVFDMLNMLIDLNKNENISVSRLTPHLTLQSLNDMLLYVVHVVGHMENYLRDINFDYTSMLFASTTTISSNDLLEWCLKMFLNHMAAICNGKVAETFVLKALITLICKIYCDSQIVINTENHVELLNRLINVLQKQHQSQHENYTIAFIPKQNSCDLINSKFMNCYNKFDQNSQDETLLDNINAMLGNLASDHGDNSNFGDLFNLFIKTKHILNIRSQKQFKVIDEQNKIIVSYQNLMNHLSTDSNTRDNELLSYQRIYKRILDKVSCLEVELNKSKSEYNALAQILSDKEINIKKLTVSLEEVNENLDSEINKKQGIQKSYDVLKHENESIGEMHQVLTKHYESAKVQLENLRQQLANAEKENHLFKKELKDKDSLVQENQQTIGNLKNTNEVNEKEIKKLHIIVEQLRKDIDSIHAERKTLIHEKMSLENTCKKQVSQISEKEESIQKLESNLQMYAEITSKISHLTMGMHKK